MARLRITFIALCLSGYNYKMAAYPQKANINVSGCK